MEWMARYSGFGFDLASCVFLRIYVGVYVQADGVLIALASAFNTKYEGKWVGIGEQGLGYKAWKGRGKDRCALAYIHVRFRLRRAYRQTCFKYRSRAARIKCVKICNVLFVSLVCGFQCSSNVLVCSNAMFLNSNHYMKSKLLDEFNSSPTSSFESLLRSLSLEFPLAIMYPIVANSLSRLSSSSYSSSYPPPYPPPYPPNDPEYLVV